MSLSTPINLPGTRLLEVCGKEFPRTTYLDDREFR
jgi:hypothetical protein